MQTGVASVPDIYVLRDKFNQMVVFAVNELRFTKSEIAALVYSWAEDLVEKTD